MANTWNGMTFTNIARAGFRAFNKRLMSLRAFSTDFSADLAEQGTIVNTRIVPVSDAAVDLQTGVAGTAGDREDTNIIKDITTSAVAVTLNQQPIAGFALTDEEAMQIGSGVWADTKNKLLQQKAWAVANAVLNYVFNLVTNASFGAAIFTGAASTFDLDDAVDISTALKGTHGWDLSDNEVAMILNSTYYGALKKDNAIQDLSASGIPVAQYGTLSRIDQFMLHEAPTLPPAGGTPASENLVGMVAKSSAIAIAMRAVQAQAEDKLEFFEIMTDPVTGATLVYRAWYKPSLGKMYHTFETLFGATAAQTEALKRMVSA